ncbi:MAG: ABC transporter ATP-binding protein [Vicinamibacterales bacterium]
MQGTAPAAPVVEIGHGQPAGDGIVVRCDDLSVRYGRNYALRDVTAAFGSGAVGLLGPNGAGKSTLIKTLLGFVTPDKGRMQVLGLDVARSPLEVRARIGYMPESDSHVPGMNAVSFVAYCGELAGLPPADAMQRSHEVLYYVGLGEARYRNLETYSTGMKQRIKLAQAIVHDPDLLFLDEPTNGMDPKGRDEMLELIRDLAHNKNVNLILSSHLLPDVEYTCDHVVVVDKGTIATSGPIRALKGTRGRVYELRIKGDQSRFVDVLRGEGLDCHDTDEDVIRVFVPGGSEMPGVAEIAPAPPPVVQSASSAPSAPSASSAAPASSAADPGARRLFEIAARERVQVRHLRPSVPTLEDVFARAVGEA